MLQQSLPHVRSGQQNKALLQRRQLLQNAFVAAAAATVLRPGERCLPVSCHVAASCCSENVDSQWHASGQPAQADLIRDLVKGYVRPVNNFALSALSRWAAYTQSICAVKPSLQEGGHGMSSSIAGLCRAVMKVTAMVQDVAADQALMQLMDARGTLMELKVGDLLTITHCHEAQSADQSMRS